MRTLGLTIAAAALAATLSGCGKSPTTTQGESPTPASSEPSTPSASSEPAEPSDHEKKELVATLPAPYNGGDLTNGEAKFAVCRSCHTLPSGGPDMTGPNLYGVFGRKVASKAGYNYSSALKGQSFTWDAEHLDKWLTDPKAMAPGTKMTFVGYKDQKDRIDVISYLKAETSPAK